MKKIPLIVLALIFSISIFAHSNVDNSEGPPRKITAEAVKQQYEQKLADQKSEFEARLAVSENRAHSEYLKGIGLGADAGGILSFVLGYMIAFTIYDSRRKKQALVKGKEKSSGAGTFTAMA